MAKQKSFTFQLFVLAGFLFFFYMFFALASSIYKDYKLERDINDFESEIKELAVLANQKPKELQYLDSDQYKDLYAKETLNLLNSGERLIVVPEEEHNIETGPVDLLTDELSPDSVLNQSNPVQWREYFFGRTLSVEQTPLSRPSEFEEEILDEVEG